MIEGLISYIRSWFPPAETTSRKRRASESIDQDENSKFSKVLSPFSSNDYDWFKFSPLSPIRSAKRQTRRHQSPLVVLDDDDLPRSSTRNIEIKLTGKKYSSTPENSHHHKMNGNNGVDDLNVTKTIKSSAEKKAEASNRKFNYIRPEKPKFSPVTPSPLSKSKARLHNSSLDYSVRLDDYKNYKQLLENASQNSSVYHSLVDKLSDYDICNRSRNKHSLIDLTENKVETVDLTKDRSNSSFRKPYVSTKDAVIKILDDFESKSDEAAIEIQDSSDSDVEILPNPPSPKPDIKVDPINSLKRVIDENESAQPKWLQEMYQNHEQRMEDRKRRIEILKENSSSLNDINNELLVKTLSRKVDNALKIFDEILPEIEKVEDETVLPQLTDEHYRMIKRALYINADPNEVLTKKFNINITRRDLQTLSGLNWLNDNVINFYMNLIIERSNDPKWPNAYCMNTFFYQKLQTSGPESLRRWTRRVDIFSMEYICVPIHLGNHWCMAIINLKEKYIKYYDSMGLPNDRCLNLLKNYLEYEHMDKKKESFSADDFHLENVQNIPQQLNGSDCGMFSCTFAEFATRKSKFNFSQENMPLLRKKMIVEILIGELLIK